MKALGILAGATILLWAVLCYPGYLLRGELGLLHGGVALGLCLVPALGTLAWATWPGTTPENRVVALLGGSGVRMLVSLGGGFLLYKGLPEWFPDSFWIWMGVFYLFVLVMEVTLVLRMQEGS